MSSGGEALSQGSTAITASIAKPSVGITFAMGIVAVLELVRDAAVIWLFGTGVVSDAYFLGIAIPMAVGGAFQSIAVQVVMPWFCLSTAADGDLARVQMSQLFFLLLFPAVVFGLTAVYLAGAVADLIAGPAINRDVLMLVLRFSLPALGLTAQSAVMSAYLNAREAYGVVAVRRVMNSALFIVTILLWHSGRAATGLGLAFLLGSVVELGWLAFFARPSPERMLPAEGVRQGRELCRLLRNSVLPSLTYVLCALGLAAERVMAGYLTVGSVATLSYGRRAILALSRIFSQGMNTVIRSKASRAYAEGTRQETVGILSQGSRLMLLVLVPLALFVIVLRVPITQMLFASAQFEAGEVARTAAVIACFAAAFPALRLVPLFLTPFWARGDTVTPSIHQLLILAVNLALDLAAVRYLGVLGIAVAHLLATLLSAFRAAWLVETQVARLYVWRDARFIGRLAVGTLCSGLTFWIAFDLAGRMVPSSWMGTFTSVVASALAGMAAFVLVETLLGVEELRQGIQWVLRQVVERARAF